MTADLIAAAKRVSWKFGHDEAGTPSDWSEWADLRAAIAAAESAQSPAEVHGEVLVTRSSASKALNHLGLCVGFGRLAEAAAMLVEAKLPDVQPKGPAVLEFDEWQRNTPRKLPDKFARVLRAALAQAPAPGDDLAETNAVLLAECDRLRGNLKSVWAKAEAAAGRRGFRLVMQMPQEHVDLVEITPSSAVAHATEYEQALSEMDGPACPRCLGSGSIPAMSNGGPDAHEIDVDCDHCGGTGSARDAYLKLSEFYRRAISELTQLRYYRWFSEQEKAKQAEKLEAAQQHAYAEGRKDEAESCEPGAAGAPVMWQNRVRLRGVEGAEFSPWHECCESIAAACPNWTHPQWEYESRALVAVSVAPCQRCNGTGEVNEGDPEIGNAYFDCPACSQPPVQHKEQS